MLCVVPCCYSRAKNNCWPLAGFCAQYLPNGQPYTCTYDYAIPLNAFADMLASLHELCFPHAAANLVVALDGYRHEQSLWPTKS